MKIVAVLERYPPSFGADRRISELLSRLDDDFDVTVCILGSVSITSSVPAFPDTWKLPTVRIADGGPPASAPVRHFANMIRAVMRGVATDCDLVIANHPSPTTGLAALAIARFASRPLIVDFNDLIAQYAADLLGIRSRSMITSLYRVQSFLLANADGIILASSYLQSYLPSAAMSVPRVVIPNGAEASPIPPRTREWRGRFRLIYAGRFEKWAGSVFLARLADELANRNLDAEIVIAGANAPAVHPNTIRYLGPIPPADVPGLLLEADAILVPFPAGPTSDAASPIKLFEAWAAGRPTLASDVAGIREVCRGLATWLLPPDEPRAWADAVQSLMNDAGLRERMARAAYESSLGSTWDERSRAFGEFLRQIRLKW